MNNQSPLRAVPSRLASPQQNNLYREVYGVLGLPIDAIGMGAAIQQVRAAATSNKRFFISTVNLNFLTTSSSDAEFRRAVLMSDLSVADGMPVVWLARLLGIPVRERVAGSDMFASLRRASSGNSISVFIFGGAEGVAARLCSQLNDETGGARCAGWHFPGFGDLAAMSTDAVIKEVNASQAQFLAVALGATKGQAWLLRNQDRITIPVRVHLGASINFEAGTIKRAPTRWRKAGFEWLWRIREEPHLWQRYFRDALSLAKILTFHVAPLLCLRIIDRLRGLAAPAGFTISDQASDREVVVYLSGPANSGNVALAAEHFQVTEDRHKNVTINLAATQCLDTRFLGLLLMLNKSLMERDLKLRLADVPPVIKRRLRLNGFDFLLKQNQA
jgi:N-acetylglucosaminyldiphosphoundecaprenol N-acetyl-beta-D-mannosaminyltransferase